MLLMAPGCSVFAADPTPQLYDEGVKAGVIFNWDCRGAGITCTKSNTTGTFRIGDTQGRLSTVATAYPGYNIDITSGTTTKWIDMDLSGVSEMYDGQILGIAGRFFKSGSSNIYGEEDLGVFLGLDGSTDEATLSGSIVLPDYTTCTTLGTDGGGALVCGGAGGAISLSDLTDVNSTTATAGRLLIADGTDWESVALSGAGTLASNGTLTITTGAGWTDGGTDVTLTTSTDNVGIGGASLAKFSIDGDTDEIQALVQASSSQTADLITVEDSAGTDVFRVRPLTSGATASVLVVNQFPVTGVTTEQSVANFNGTNTWTVADSTTIGTQRHFRVTSPTWAGVAGGGTETITNGATFYVSNAPTNGGNLTITNSYAAWVDDGTTRLDGLLSMAGGTYTIATGNGDVGVNDDLEVNDDTLINGDLTVDLTSTLTGNVDTAGTYTTSGDVPAVSACGTTPSIASTGTDEAGKVTVGSGAIAGGTCTVTFADTHTVAPACYCTNETAANLCRAVSTTTTLTLTGVAASEVIAYGCNFNQ